MNIRELFNKIFNKETKMKDRTLFDYLSDSVRKGKVISLYRQLWKVKN